MHYLRVRYGIHPLSLGVSMPATAIPRLPPGFTTRGTAELRRRIITFYADFNTRLRPVPSVSPCHRLVGIVSPLSPRCRISNRRFRYRTLQQRREFSSLSRALHASLRSSAIHRRRDFFDDRIECLCRSG